jgi:surface protein
MRRHRRRKKQNKVVILLIIEIIFLLSAGYAAFSSNILVSGTGTIIEKSRVIKSWTSTSDEDFHTDFYRENIVTATFLDSNAVPSNAVESWDVSENKDGGVMAYVIESSSETGKYDLYIGANKGVIGNTDSSYLFFAFSNLKNIEFNDNYDTSNVTSMWRMFAGGNSITELDVSDFDTSNVISMSGMFTAWNFEKVACGNRSITKIIFGEIFNTSKVSSMSDMFSFQPLTELDLSGFDTSEVTNMWHMFIGCTKLTELNLCSFNTSKVTQMTRIFKDTTSLKNIYVGSGWTTANADTTDMFKNSGVSSVITGLCSSS